MFKFWKSKKKQDQDLQGKASAQNTAFLNAVRANTIERRQYVRVRYTPVGAIGDLPSIQWENQFLDVTNLSQGGLLLASPPMPQALTGQEFQFRFHWPHRRLEIWNTGQLVRIQRAHWHFQFTKIDEKFTRQLPSLMKTAIRAQKTGQVREHEIPSGENIVELWMSALGDFVLFQAPPKESRERAVVCYNEGRYRLDAVKGLITYNKVAGVIDETPVLQSTIDTLMIFLSNLPAPTPRVQKLISDLVDRYYRTLVKKTA